MGPECSNFWFAAYRTTFVRERERERERGEDEEELCSIWAEAMISQLNNQSNNGFKRKTDWHHLVEK